MVNLFCKEVTSRIDYAVRLIFETILNDKVLFFNSKETFIAADGFLVNYSEDVNLPGFHIMPHTLLSEKGIHGQDISISIWDNVPVFFTTSGRSLPFDIFSASFYLVSRYEEILSSNCDIHGRFQAEESIAYKNEFLDKPIVNIWAKKLARLIETSAGNTNLHHFIPNKFSYLPTFDVDNAWAYKNKGLARTVAATARDISTGKWHQAKERIDILAGRKNDPFDSFNFISTETESLNIRPLIFFLLGDYGHFDKNISPRNNQLHSLINSLKSKFDVGIHPSYASYGNREQIKKEINRLKSITSNNVTQSRQHYLRMSLPNTYRDLISCGITKDFTMGYSTHTGFRAGICTPFNFFDPSTDELMNIKVYPFQVMDVTLRHFLNLDTRSAIEKINDIIAETAAVGGVFTSVWHNESLSENAYWKGWRDVFKKMIYKASNTLSANRQEA